MCVLFVTNFSKPFELVKDIRAEFQCSLDIAIELKDQALRGDKMDNDFAFRIAILIEALGGAVTIEEV